MTNATGHGLRPATTASDRRTVLSACRLYRYTLWRDWIGGEGYAMFIGLNPSTADERDDPTIRRCVALAMSWGYSALCMTNLFAFRTTSPKLMKAAADPIGPDNDTWLESAALSASIVVAAWGVHGGFMGRDFHVRNLIPRLHHIGLTRAGQPRHPLFVLGTATPAPLEPGETT
jgi:hypothetical protein